MGERHIPHTVVASREQYLEGVEADTGAAISRCLAVPVSENRPARALSGRRARVSSPSVRSYIECCRFQYQPASPAGRGGQQVTGRGRARALPGDPPPSHIAPAALHLYFHLCAGPREHGATGPYRGASWPSSSDGTWCNARVA